MIPFSYNNNAVEYTVGFGYFGILSNLRAASIRIESNSNRTHRRISCLVRKCFLLGYADATITVRNNTHVGRYSKASYH